MPNIPAHAAFKLYRDNIQLTDAAAQSYLQGAFVYLDGSGNVNECGADPIQIYGVACGPAGKHPEGTTVTTISKAEGFTKFWMQCATTPSAANQSNSYGITKDANGIWNVDLAKTDPGQTRVFVEQVDTSGTNMVLVHVLDAYRQITS